MPTAPGGIGWARSKIGFESQRLQPGKHPMLIKRKRGWEMPEKEATPEAVYQDRRRLLKTMGFGALFASAAGVGMADWVIGQAYSPNPTADPSAGLSPLARNSRYTLDP